MGTDIWMYAERRVGDHWELASPMEDNELFDAKDPEDEPPYKPGEIYDGRDYALFAILADVRNPAYSAENYECISLPQGLHPDLSPELREWAEYFEVGDPMGGHDPGWLTLQEILDFDWHGKIILKKAVVDEAVRHLFHADQPFPNEGGPAGQRIEYSDGGERTRKSLYNGQR